MSLHGAGTIKKGESKIGSKLTSPVKNTIHVLFVLNLHGTTDVPRGRKTAVACKHPRIPCETLLLFLVLIESCRCPSGASRVTQAEELRVYFLVLSACAGKLQTQLDRWKGELFWYVVPKLKHNSKCVVR